jgi:hypothetical protein
MVQKCKPKKIQSNHQFLFALLGFASEKAARKALVKYGPEVTLKNTWLKDKTKLPKVYGLEMETYIFTPKAT